MKKFKSLVCIIFVFCFIVGANSYASVSQPKINNQLEPQQLEQLQDLLNEYASRPDIKYTIKETYPLCNMEGYETYTLYELEPYGYAIIQNDGDVLMEASFMQGSANPYLTTNGPTSSNTVAYYYGGPNSYFKLTKDAQLVDAITGTVIEDQILASLIAREQKVLSVLPTSIQTSNAPSVQPRVGVFTSYVERDYFVNLTDSYFPENTNGSCTTVATCILLGYYANYVSSAFVKSQYRIGKGTTQAFHDYMLTYTDPDGNYEAFIGEAVTGMNKYFSDQGIKNAEAHVVTGPNPTGPAMTVSTVKASITNGYPLIANMEQTVLHAPYYHSVVIYGVATNSYNPPETQTCFICHMGWRDGNASNRELYCSSLWFWDSGYITYMGKNNI